MQQTALPWLVAGLTSIFALSVGCSAGTGVAPGGGGSNAGGGGSDSSSSKNTGGATNSGPSTTTTVATGPLPSGSGATTGPGVDCDDKLDFDFDKDGFTDNDGDCNDCDPNVNPGALEVIAEPANGETPEPADEDCDGQVDNVITECDQGLALNGDAEAAARAIDICTKADPAKKTSGLVEAKFVRANGSTANPGVSAGILNKFGNALKPRGGGAMLGLSSGTARDKSQPQACGSSTCQTLGGGSAPSGFPQDVPGCDGGQDINDDIALEVRLKAPKNATGYAFDFNFMTFEYPEYVCTTFNDQFITLVSPAPTGSINGNVSFDSQKNPVSVNIAFFDVCKGCALGEGELSGTGFDTWDDDDLHGPNGENDAICEFTFGGPCTCEDIGAGKGCDEAGGTSWLETRAPVTGGDEITVRFAIWDTGDQALDSTVLVDHFRWIANGGTVAVGTNPVPK